MRRRGGDQDLACQEEEGRNEENVEYFDMGKQEAGGNCCE